MPKRILFLYNEIVEEIQNKKPDLSTKMVIRPFFAREDFNTLEVHCVHTPPWLEDEVLLGNILMNVEKYDEEAEKLKIIVRRYYFAYLVNKDFLLIV